MLPRWFRCVVAAEVAAAVVTAVLLVHLLAGGARSAGSVIAWARPGPAPALAPPAAATLPPTPRAAPRAAGVLPPGLGLLLDRGTGGEYAGEWALVQLFESVLREQAAGLLPTGPAPRASPVPHGDR